MPEYRAIIFDLDGTAIPNRSDGVPSSALIRAVSKAKDTLHLIAATARPISHALHILQKLKLSDLCIISGGTTIIDPTNGKVVREARLNQKQLDEIRKVCMDFPYVIGMDDELPEQRKLATERRLVGSANIVFIPRVESKDVTALTEALSNIPGVHATSTKGWTGGQVMHVTTSDGTKEYGIGYVLRQLKVKRSQTIGVGDGDNDIHLFAAVGHRIAMGNGSEQLKAAADEIAPSIDEDGLAWVIEKYSNQDNDYE